MKSRRLTQVVHAIESQDDFDRFDGLVEELMKQKPQEERIKAYMRNVGLEYESDPIARLTMVLQAIEQKEKAR